MNFVPDEVRDRAAAVRALVLDVDGVLTDGRLHYGEAGEAIKTFHVRDGLGVRLLLREGIVVALITAKRSPMIVQRAADLRIPHVFVGREDKRAAIGELCAATGLRSSDLAYVGDDLIDWPAMRAVGLAITVGDAHPFIRARAAWITQASGGNGAVREVADGLLEARGRLEAAYESLAGELGG